MVRYARSLECFLLWVVELLSLRNFCPVSYPLNLIWSLVAALSSCSPLTLVDLWFSNIIQDEKSVLFLSSSCLLLYVWNNAPRYCFRQRTGAALFMPHFLRRFSCRFWVGRSSYRSLLCYLVLALKIRLKRSRLVLLCFWKMMIENTCSAPFQSSLHSR